MGRSRKNQPTKRRVFGPISPPLFFLPVIRRKHFSNTQQHAIIQITPIIGAMIGALSLGAKTKVAEPIRHNIVKRPSTTPTGTSTQRGSCLSSGSISEGSSWFMWHNGGHQPRASARRLHALVGQTILIGPIAGHSHPAWALGNCVAIAQVFPHGSLTLPRLSGSPSLVRGSSTGVPPAAIARANTRSTSFT